MPEVKKTLFITPVTESNYSRKVVANAELVEKRMIEFSGQFGINPPKMKIKRGAFPEAGNALVDRIVFSEPFLNIANEKVVDAVAAHEFVHYYKKDEKKYSPIILLSYGLEIAGLVYSVITQSFGMAIGTVLAANAFLGVLVGKMEERTDFLASKLIGKKNYREAIEEKDKNLLKLLKEPGNKWALAKYLLMFPYSLIVPFTSAIFAAIREARGKEV